jgi:PIN domain nuclease of toxin-antitoxin system
LPVTLRHADQVASLARHHTDPFDRMLVAQALVERLTLVTHDRQFESYGIPILWV